MVRECDRETMRAPSVEGDCCAVCGRYPAERHHVVFRSQGGGDGPTIPLCGHGNTSGCHGKAHGRLLHFRWVADVTDDDGLGHWEYLEADAPIRPSDALRSDGWMELGHQSRSTHPSRQERLEWLREIAI